MGAGDVTVEIARFIMIAVGTFVSVLSLSFAVFNHWKKRQDEKFELLRRSIGEMVQNEEQGRRDADSRHEKRLSNLENMMSSRFENRLSVIEGELKGMRGTLEKIQQWFIDNAGGR